ncbi:bifunctional RNA recognition motif domain/Nucleotide-binding alpha-beta plait domain superfamily/RNA-binding domain superfamily [Babesia duncani]|uniref:Bifunctional RNA recognition motif domain/Nucleotide-binding alpha-beta plait domain superfamily/RNA-binding domain superfamily n=1 Tax=Babesia duncani TaxID=323732 RepID=A0AAD9UQF3_9APIC|nr:bifunctional RNA recognition motif domain/Nucleotide-binding alpha-beta plait domain superfamily/RNA-binding domain superfamily [Babesia duncani]
MGSRVIYVGNLPTQLTEEQIRQYFAQFGKIQATRLMRSKKTNNSRGFAFVKFESAEIAKIAAEAMDRYIINGRTLRCNLKDVVVKNLFRKPRASASKRTRLLAMAARDQDLYKRCQALEQDSGSDPVQMRKILERLERRLSKLQSDEHLATLYIKQRQKLLMYIDAIKAKIRKIV